MQGLTARRGLLLDVNVAMALALLVVGIVEAMTTAPDAPSWPDRHEASPV